ncbi:MAG: hypothetical protein OXJ64_16800 [Boseongicola sp.]|nr:hypothetical protein [Boseongicola sp.]
MRPTAIHLGMILVLAAGGCTRSPSDGEGSVDEFVGTFVVLTEPFRDSGR